MIGNPFFHSFGYKVGWLAGRIAGLTVLPDAVFDARAILKRIAAERIPVLPGPPTLFISLLDDPERANTDLSSLRATLSGPPDIAPSPIGRLAALLGLTAALTGTRPTKTRGTLNLAPHHHAPHTTHAN